MVELERSSADGGRGLMAPGGSGLQERQPLKTADESSVVEIGGRQYAACDEYFSAVDEQRPLAQVAHLPVYEGTALAKHQSKSRDTTFLQFTGKFYEAALVLDALRMVDRLRRFERALDIGSGPAIQPRVLKLLGYVDAAEAMDIYDARARCPDGLFRRYAASLAGIYPAYEILNRLPQGVGRLSAKVEGFRRKFPPGVESFGHRPSSRFLRLNPLRRFQLDAFHIRESPSQSGAYDLVTSFMAIDYFNFESFAATVASMLKPGGIFAFLVSYWWYPINNTLLFGRIPYLLQQFATEEVIPYFSTYHSELPIDGIRRRLTYSDPVRRTVGDYETAAFKAGFLPLLTLRLHPPHERNSRAVIGPLAIDRLKGWSLEQILANSRRLRPDLHISDLMTSHILMVFERR